MTSALLHLAHADAGVAYAHVGMAAIALSSAAKAYLALFLGIWAATLGVPIPEEVPLLTAGVLAAMGVISIPGAIVVGMLACFSGDLFVYGIGRRIGSHMEDHPRIRKMLRGRHLRKARYLYVNRGPWTLFFARLMPGLKMPFLFTAGALRMPWRRFLLYDIASICLLVPGLVFLAYHSSMSAAQLTEIVRKFGAIAVPVFLGLLALLILAWVLVRRQRRRHRAGA